jgi:RNA polymerase sigma-70 factor (ECF subfamily)
MQHRPFPFTRSPASIGGVPTDQAFTTAVERHRDELHRHCARILGSRVDGEDAVQETLLRAWRSRRTLACDPSRAWLYRIATNACFDMLARRDPGVATLESAPEPSTPPEQRPDALLDDREALELTLLTAIQELPPRQQATFVLRDVLNWSAIDAAGALATTVPAANSALQRARSVLRARLSCDRLDWACAAPCATQRRTLRRYLSAVDAPCTLTAAKLMVGT